MIMIKTFFLFVLFLLIVGLSGPPTGKGAIMCAQERVRVRAPEISGGRGWLNTDKPLSLAAL